MQKAIAYYRVSTGRQKRSGLGIQAQQKSVQDFADSNRLRIINDYIETNSGARNGRIGLVSALAECKQQNAILLISALDRLSRRVAFIATLLESEVDFIVVNHPNADDFTLHILAAVAQKERSDTSQRTIAALAAAKRRGVELGTFGKYVQSKKNRLRAERFAKKIRPVINALKKQGITTVRALACELNKMSVPTFYKDGHKWHPSTVHRLIKRLTQ